MTVSFEMVVPGVIGVWLDGLLDTRVVFTILGFGVGLTVGTWHLVRMTQSNNGGDNKAD